VLNWKIRYSKIMEEHRDLFDASKSVLEVGCGSAGIAQYLKRRVTGLEPGFRGPTSEWLNPVTGDLLDLPFPPEHFDIVLCVDIIERLPPPSRKRALAELVRVAKEKVILSCPCDLFATEGERSLAEVFRETSLGVPPWLADHVGPGLPDVGDMIELIMATGLEFQVIGNEGLLQHYGGILLDYFFPFAAKAHKVHAYKALVDPPLARGPWDLFYSYVFTVFKASAQSDGATALPRARPDGPSESEQPAKGARVFSVFHKRADTAHLGRIEPIFAGTAADAAPAGALTDVPQREPRLLNSRWSELSAIYKVWREGPRAEVVGFCHYRRLFNFDGRDSAERQTTLAWDQLADRSAAFFDESVVAAARENVIITPPPFAVDAATIWHHYCIWHDPSDWCRILNAVSRRYPTLLPHALTQFRVRELLANNMFIMSWALFDELCGIWFDLLKDFEHQVPARRSTTYQNRDISFLAERIFDMWTRSKQQAGTRLVHVPMFFIDSTGK
jgi:SAM-dependent methyltransferase